MTARKCWRSHKARRWGLDHKELIQAKSGFSPAHYSHVEDYLEAVKLAGAEVLGCCVAVCVPLAPCSAAI